MKRGIINGVILLKTIYHLIFKKVIKVRFSRYFMFYYRNVDLIFYKGLKNPNIYTPNLNVEKNIPIFKAQIFQKEKLISSEEIFKQDKFYLLNIWIKLAKLYFRCISF